LATGSSCRIRGGLLSLYRGRRATWVSLSYKCFPHASRRASDQTPAARGSAARVFAGSRELLFLPAGRNDFKGSARRPAAVGERHAIFLVTFLRMVNKQLPTPLRALVVMICGFTASGCGEVTSAEYADRHEAIARRAIGESKWLPAWLPDGAVDIREAHDVDTNESWLVFRLSKGPLTLPRDCKQTGRPEMPQQRVIRRFPQFARDAWSRASSHAGLFHLCPEGNADRWILHDEELGLFYSRVKF
jgi:hypothetical protein